MMVIVGDKSIDLIVLDGYFSKHCGLMFKKGFKYAARLKCNGIHTMFMKERIDVVLCDKLNRILCVYKNFRPWRIILPKKNVFYTYEFPVGFLNDIKINDYLKIKDI